MACIEEIAYAKGFIDQEQILRLAERNSSSSYGAYLRQSVKHYPQPSVSVGNRVICTRQGGDVA